MRFVIPLQILKREWVNNVSTKTLLRQIVGLVLMIGLLAGCSPSTPPAPTAEPPTSVPPTAEATATVEPVAPTPTASAEVWQVTDNGRIEFQPNATSWYTNGDLSVNTAGRFVLSAMKGQQMSVWLSTEPDSSDVPQATLYITGADGTVFTPNPTLYWSQVLPASQDYFIEIRSLAQQELLYTISIDIPATVIDPALGEKYEPVSREVCQVIQELASQALAADFYVQEIAPFMDAVAGEAGQGCRLMTSGDGNKFASPQSVVQTLVGSAGQGWTEQPAYQADGPTGAATALTRDMGLMLINAEWMPAMGVICPSDQPIADCNLTPDQKTYVIQIDVAQYRADFSLDGHWEDAATGFSLDLYQDWKNIYGHHTVVAQGGNKIDTLDVSINGSLQGQVANVQFKSSFTDDVGEAQITYIDVNTISWKIITPPQGEYYLPAEATLTRK